MTQLVHLCFALTALHTSWQVVPSHVRCRDVLSDLPRTALSNLPRTVLSDLSRTVLSELPRTALSQLLRTALSDLPQNCALRPSQACICYILASSHEKGNPIFSVADTKRKFGRKPWSEDVISIDLYVDCSIVIKHRLKGTMGEKWFQLAHAIDLKQTLLKLPSLSREISWPVVGNKHKNARNTKKDKSNLDLRRSLRSKKRTLYVDNKSVRPSIPSVCRCRSVRDNFFFPLNSLTVLFTDSSRASSSFVKIGLSKSYFTSGGT